MKNESPIVLVTGATDGIGLKTAEMLLERGARVIVSGRRQERIDAAMKALAPFGKDRLLAPARGDLASLDDVRRMAAQIEKEHESLDVILNNAGIFEKKRKLSADGFELTFAVNHLAPFLLTHLLLAGALAKNVSRVVNVSSGVHSGAQIDLDDLNFEERSYSGYGAYAQSKLANVLFTVELAKRTKPRHLKVNSLHPGVVGTKLLREGFGGGGYDSLEESSRTSVLLALDKVGGEASGKYFSNEREARMNALANDTKLTKTFYERSAKLVGVAPIEGA